MSLWERHKAIEKIEERVCEGLYKGRLPEVLIRFLFSELRDALADGKLAARLPRRTVVHEVEKKLPEVVSDSAFKKAVRKMSSQLALCRPADRSLLPMHDNRSGVAAIDFTVDRTPHLVLVRGVQHGTRASMLELEAEFRPLPARKAEPEVIPPSDAVMAGGRLSIAAADAALPREIDRSLREILENMASADRIFRENEHAHDFIRAHFSEVVERLRHESLLWALGEIDTDYDDFLLWTSWVAKLGDGDELVGLSDWESVWEWWGSVDGRQFLHANDIALRRNAVIRRMFVHQAHEDPHKKTLRLAEMARHHDLGIEVRTLASTDEVVGILLSDLRSCSVLRARNAHGALQGWLTYKVDTDDGNDGVLRNRFSINPMEIRENERMLQRLWQIAVKYEPAPRSVKTRAERT
jgi:hypothetical protein